MPQLAANLIFNSSQPNFARDQVQTMEELFTYGGWNVGDPRYDDSNEANLTKIDLGHITFVVETNQHYTYVRINEVDEHDQLTGGYHYGWVVFDGGSGEEAGPDPGTNPGSLSLYTYFKSLVFKRGSASQAPATPEGGSFSNPVPQGWSDGVPAVTVEGEEAIWMSTRIFSSALEDPTALNGSTDPVQGNWTTPSLIADTEWKDFEFSELEELDAEHAVPDKTYPSDTSTNGWSNTATERTIWMAMRDVESGAYKAGSSWEVVKIKGEDGEQALKIKICGQLSNVSDLEGVANPEYLDAYVIGNDIYVWDGDSWENSGPFRGTYDNTKDWAYLHIKYSDDGGVSFTAFGGEVPGKWVGTYCDYVIQDSSNVAHYFWKQVSGGDGYGYEYIYKLTSDDQAPDVPDDHENDNDDDWNDFDFVPNNWTDDPGGINETFRWCWVCYRVFVNGQWSEFKGAQGKTAAENGVAALYAHYAIDNIANSASRSFMIFTWTNLNTSLQVPAPYVPLKPSDNAARWDAVNNVLVLNSGQSWNWSNNGQTGIWSTNPGNAQAKFLWMSTATFSEAENGQIIGSWSDPVRLTGDDGRNGTDGISTAFGYHLCDDMDEFSALVAPTLTDSTDNDSFVSGSGWTDHPQGISPAHPIEAASVGTYNEQNGTWSYGTPFIWARWGEDGIDGDGVEYLFYVATESDVVKTDIMEAGQKVGENVELENLNWLPMTAAQLSEFLGGDQEKIDAFYYDHNTEWLPVGCGWTDDPSDVGPFQPYEFVSIRRYSASDGRWGFWSEPALWAKYGKDGTNGRSVFTSFAFTRTTLDLSTAKVFGGTTANPLPTSTKNAAETETINVTWTDSVPSNSNAPVWMTSRIFDDSLTGEGTGWKTPTKLQDTPEFQVEYTDEEVWDTSALPSLNNYIDWVNFPLEGIDEPAWRQAAYTATAAHWGDIGEGQNDIVDPWWMITARRSNGVWSSWAIHKIKGEKGEPGTSISVKGSLSSYTDLGDLNGSPAGQVDHSSVSVGDCYVINGLLWIYDDNSTKTSPYSTTYVTDPSGTGQILGDKYAGFSCQGQFKGDPGDTSWIHIRFANKSEDQSTAINSSTIGYRYYYNNEVYIEFTGNDHSGVIPGKYAGIAITSDANVAPSSITAYEWTEWRGDDIYGTEQIFTLSAERPATPTRPNNVSEADWYTFDYVPRIPIAGTDPVEYQEWSDTPLEATPNAHCWVSTRRLSDPNDNGWKTPVIYSRYAQDGDDGIDGSVNEFIYHLGDKGTAPQIVLSSAKKGNTVESNPTAAWWASDDSRDYCPADSNSGYWTDNPQGVADASGQRVEYYAYRTRDYDDEHNRYTWTSWSAVKVWSSWGEKGHDGDGVEYIFTLTELYNTPEDPTPLDKTAVVDGKHWEDYDFVPKVPIAGTSPVEYQQWYDDPQEVDSTNRYQWVSMRRSHADSNGDAQWTDFSVPVLWNKYTEDGKDGRTEEFIYILSKFNNNQPIAPTIDATKAFGVVNNTPQYYGIEPNTEPDWQELEDFLPALGNPTALYPNNPSGNVIWWNDNPQSISEEWPLEYCASRFKKDGVWSNWGTPYIWSSWGQRGHDGDGVEYIFTRTVNKDVVPDLTVAAAFADYNGKSWTDDDYVPEGWTDDPQGVTKDLRVEWVAIRKTYEGEWPASGARKCWSDPKIWKEYDDSILEEEIYHYGGKTTDPTLSATVDYKGRTTIDGTPVYALDGFIPADTSAAPYYSGEGAYDPNGWTPFMKGIDATNKYEYRAVRKKNPDTGVWGSFRISRIAAWGEDGPGTEFVFFLLTAAQHTWVQQVKNNSSEVLPSNTQWTDTNSVIHDPQDDDFLPEIVLFNNDADPSNDEHLRAIDDMAEADMTSSTPYLYASRRSKSGGIWGNFSGIFLYNQLYIAPEYSSTLNLEEDTQGVAVYLDNDHFVSYLNRSSVGLTGAELRYGSSAQIINKVSVAPVIKTKSGNNINISMGTETVVWQYGSPSGSYVNINLGGNQVRITVNKTDTFYTAWFSWSASSPLQFMKDADGNPVDLSFVLYAYGSTTESASALERCGTATYNIHPIVGDTVYEIDPWDELFKKKESGEPYNKSSISSFFWKRIYSTQSNSYYQVNGADWDSSQDTNDNMKIVYWIDDDTQNAVEIDHKLTMTDNNSGNSYYSAVGQNNEYSWTLKDNVDSDGDHYLYFTIDLYKSVSGGTYIDYVSGIEDGITIQLWVGNQLHDEEFIPVVYNGKQGKRGDYYKDEYAYWLQPGDTAPSAPAPNVQLASVDTQVESNNVGKWLVSPVSPSVTNRYLFASKRLNRYAGDNDGAISVDDLLVAGTWETPFLFASRSVGQNGDDGRGVSSITEYYLWTANNTLTSAQSTAANATPPSSPWSSTYQAPSGTDKYLWNFEIVAYTTGSPTRTAPAIIGTIGDDGNGIDTITEYYKWSANSSSETAGGANGTGWYTMSNLQTPSGSEKYLWNYEVVTFTNASPTISTPIVISVKGDKGDDGKYSQFVYFRSKIEADTTKFSRVTAGDTTITDNGQSELLPCWRYNSSQYISAKTSGTYQSGSNFGKVTDDPSGVDDTWRYEYESMGIYDPSNTAWSFSTPALHNYKAEDGDDGDPGTTKVELYKRSGRNTTLSITSVLVDGKASIKSLVQAGWTLTKSSITTNDSYPVIWAVSTLVPVTETVTENDETQRTWDGPYKSFERGTPGTDGDTVVGPTLRGPVKWTNATGRNWLSGKGETGITDSDKWIDIVTYTYTESGQEVTHYYKCKKSHASGTGASIVPNVSNSEYWDQADAEYKFIATEVLLAQNASIDFVSSNALLLKNQAGTVVGGAKGVDVTNSESVVFWAGANNTESNINSAPFRVTYGGLMTSTSGNIGGWNIGQTSLSAVGSTAGCTHDGVTYSANSTPAISLTSYNDSGVGDWDMLNVSVSLTGEGMSGTSDYLYHDPANTLGYVVYHQGSSSLNFSPGSLVFSGTEGQQATRPGSTLSRNYTLLTTIHPGELVVKFRNSGDTYDKVVRIANGELTVGKVVANTDNTNYAAKLSINGLSLRGVGKYNGNNIVSTPGLLESMKIVFVTSDSTLFTSPSGHWHFNGEYLGYDTSDYEYCVNHSVYGWVLATTNSTNPSSYVETGVLSTDCSTYTSLRSGTTIYITI